MEAEVMLGLKPSRTSDVPSGTRVFFTGLASAEVLG